MTPVVTFNYTCTLCNITKYYNELIQVSSELSVSDMFNVICLVQVLSYARFSDRINDGSIVKKKGRFFTGFSRVAPDTGGRMADRNEAAPPFHPRPRVPPGSRQHTLTGGNVIFRGKTSFSGLNGKLPLSSEKS